MKKQFNAFIGGEADAWLQRNKTKIEIKNDPVLHSMETLCLHPSSVLEVGCADGWRLKEIKKRYKSRIAGIDPCHTNNAPHIHLGGAHDLDYFGNECFDLVIYGFCLYLCDRDDLFNIAREGDRVLAKGGHLVIYDFHARRTSKVPYKHKEGLFSYHMDYSKLWKWNPAYQEISRMSYNTDGSLTEVTVLQKKSAK